MEQEQREQQERENFLDLSINISSLSTSQDNGGDDSNSEASHSWTLIEIPANLDRTGSSVLEDTSEQDIANLNITIPPTPPSTSDSNITMVEKEDKIIGITYTWVLTPIPERRLRTTDIAFKIHSTIFEDKIIYCVNFTPFGHVLLFSLNKLVNYFFPWSDVTICAKILQEHLNIPLYRGNSEQIELLHRYHIISSLVPDDSPLVLLQDLYDHICELKRKIK
ncbi:Hypothetical protein CINCED_3A019790 [Cinara cedri]|uniref:Uncharacterized protein n=1 Tax=Cinara cedri TaxID=506608 RepID=A0A5E4N0J2_9HEMI|nr:Hypothetical protein CINCED_3A019790 [Cinara cedri]